MADFDTWRSNRYAPNPSYCDAGPHNGMMRVIGALYMTAEEHERYLHSRGIYLKVEIPEPEEK